jgi:hypothetical protein
MRGNLTVDQQLQNTIDYLTKLEWKCFASRSRFAFYGYLAGVFAFYLRLRRKNQAKTAAQRIVTLFELRKRREGSAVRLARTSGVVKKFFDEHGGIAGCAAQFTALKAAKQDTHRVVYRCPGTGLPYLIIER